jgi:hypothetical protein
VLMPMTPLAGAERIAQKVIEAVTALALPHAGSGYGIVTVSIGIASSTLEVGFHQFSWSSRRISHFTVPRRLAAIVMKFRSRFQKRRSSKRSRRQIYKSDELT